MVILSLDESRSLMKDKFITTIVDGEVVLKESTIVEVLRGEVKLGRIVLEEYYQTQEDGKIILEGAKVLENEKPEIIRFADDEKDTDEEFQGKEELSNSGEGYLLVLKCIKKTEPLEDILITTYVVRDEEGYKI